MLWESMYSNIQNETLCSCALSVSFLFCLFENLSDSKLAVVLSLFKFLVATGKFSLSR